MEAQIERHKKYIKLHSKLSKVMAACKDEQSKKTSAKEILVWVQSLLKQLVEHKQDLARLHERHLALDKSYLSSTTRTRDKSPIIVLQKENRNRSYSSTFQKVYRIPDDSSESSRATVERQMRTNPSMKHFVEVGNLLHQQELKAYHLHH